MAWKIDPAHTQVEFSGKHMVVTTVRGRFTDFSGTLDLNPTNLEQSSVEWTVQTASLTTHNEQRDGHLRSPEFFDVAQYPTMTFRSTQVKGQGGGRYAVTGDLTIKDVTRPVTFEVTDEGHGKSPFGANVWAFSVQGTINRKDWGLNWNVALESGGVLVSDQIKISLDVEATEPVSEPALATA